jgi:hypothetical protein
MQCEGKLTETLSMAEAEVALRLAFWLLDHTDQKSHAEIAIDGAHVRIRAHQQGRQQIEERIVFGIRGFLQENHCEPKELKDEWRGSYFRKGNSLNIRSVQGFDVQVNSGTKQVRAECKGGPLRTIKGRSPTAILANAIGQVLVSASNAGSEELLVAVPDSPAFEKAGSRISRSHAFSKTGIKIALVSKTDVRLVN